MPNILFIARDGQSQELMEKVQLDSEESSEEEEEDEEGEDEDSTMERTRSDAGRLDTDAGVMLILPSSFYASCHCGCCVRLDSVFVLLLLNSLRLHLNPHIFLTLIPQCLPQPPRSFSVQFCISVAAFLFS